MIFLMWILFWLSSVMLGMAIGFYAAAAVMESDHAKKPAAKKDAVVPLTSIGPSGIGGEYQKEIFTDSVCENCRRGVCPVRV